VICIRCQEHEAPGPLGLCSACIVHTRLEVAMGLRRLDAYRDAWATFDEWLRRRGRGSAFA
jgi:hypothetical protein